MQIQLIQNSNLTATNAPTTWLNFTFLNLNQELPLGWLNAKERSWLQGKTTKRATTFIWSRALLRRLCCEKMQVTAEQVDISLPAAAKTTLVVGGKSMYCSISHSQQLVAVMISSSSDIGLDVEWMSNTRDQFSYAELYPALLHYCSSVASFYQRWTALEATVKLNGGHLFELLAQQNPAIATEVLHWQHQNYQFCIASASALNSCNIEQIDSQTVINTKQLPHRNL